MNTTQQTLLAQKVAPPPKPTDAALGYACCSGCLTFVILVALLGQGASGKMSDGATFFTLTLSVVVMFFVFMGTTGRKQEALKQWHKKMEIFEKTWICHSCGEFFLGR